MTEETIQRLKDLGIASTTLHLFQKLQEAQALSFERAMEVLQEEQPAKRQGGLWDL